MKVQKHSTTLASPQHVHTRPPQHRQLLPPAAPPHFTEDSHAWHSAILDSVADASPSDRGHPEQVYSYANALNGFAATLCRATRAPPHPGVRLGVPGRTTARTSHMT
ncbi:hypothetical protein D1007_30619 [Hordeum vulgare]|nr:hypothetical protein D1007_30619 [Hordeum vulgare]